jgi:glycosyltransferase involved in cell wall biosynthesis
MRRCLLVFDAPDGGVAEHVLRLALGLGDRGWEPWIAGPRAAVIYSRLAEAGVPVLKLPFRSEYRHVVADGRVMRRLLALLRGRRFELVNTHSPKAGVLGRLAALGARVPVVVTAHGFAFNPAVRGPTGRVVSLGIERLLAPRTSSFICVSEAVRRLALERRLAMPGALHTVHNGAPACDPGLAPIPELDAFSREGPLAGCITVLRPDKGVETFLEAAPLVLDRLPAARLAVIGSGSLREDLEGRARTAGLDGRLRFFDYTPPSARQLRSLDVFVLPSPWEAFPIAPLEAMACGVPQVATNVGGVPEAVSDGETGLLCPPRDGDRLADRIVRLLGDPQLRSRMSEASRQRHRRLFTLERMLDRTAALFDRVVSPPEQLPRDARRAPRSTRDREGSRALSLRPGS